MKKIFYLPIVVLFFASLSAVPAHASLDLTDKTANNLSTNTFLKDPSLQAYYKLENTNDSKGSNNLTNNNSVSFNTAKYANGADGGSTDGNKSLTSSSRLNYTGGAYTMSFWVKEATAPASGEYQTFLMLSDGTTSETGLYVTYNNNAGTKRLFFSRVKWGGYTDQFSYNVDLGTTNWHHIVLSYDGSTLHGYVDGTSVGSVAASGSGSGSNPGDGLTILGEVNVPNADNTLGIIDDVAMFNRSFTANEVSNIYSSTGELGSTLTDADMEITTSLPFAGSSKAINLSGYQYLTAPDSASLSMTSKATVEFWLKFNSLPASGNTMYLVSKRDDAGSDSGYGFGIRNSNGTYQLIGVANQSADSSNRDVYKWDWTPSTGTWYHLAMTTDATHASASTFKLFIDGTSQGNGDALTSDNISSIRDADSPLLIGCEFQSGVTANCADAKFDDVRIWDVVRSDSDISNNRSTELTGRESGFVSYYPMEPL